MNSTKLGEAPRGFKKEQKQLDSRLNACVKQVSGIDMAKVTRLKQTRCEDSCPEQERVSLQEKVSVQRRG